MGENEGVSGAGTEEQQRAAVTVSSAEGARGTPAKKPGRTPLKRLVEWWLAHKIGVPLAYHLLNWIRRTWKVERINPERAHMKPAVFAIWHGDLVVGAFELPRIMPSVDVLTSRSRDGALVTRFVHMFKGARTIRGGSSKGGTGALLSMTRSLKRGRAVVIPIDGPRGPFSRVKPGVILAASQSGAPIVPGAVLTDRAWRFTSWDRMFVCKPGARVRFIYGEPFQVGENLSKEQIEEARAELERRLMALHTAADGLIGSNDGPAGREKHQR